MAIRRPSLLNRALSTPPETPLSLSSTSNSLDPVNSSLHMLTPPASPFRSRSSSNLSQQSMTLPPGQSFSNNLHEGHSDAGRISLEPTQSEQYIDGILICPIDVEVLHDQHGRDRIFGHGAWSTVFKGTVRSKAPSASQSGLATPPLSPTLAAPVVVAIKRPVQSAAVPVLKGEARILSYLSRLKHCSDYVVTFYGTLLDQTSLVLAAIPCSLEDHIKRCSVVAKHDLTTWNMSQPVIGSTQTWLSLARTMISALLWLHEKAGVVHGDVKPGNFLLLPKSKFDEDEFAFQPLFIDFSSSHRLGLKDAPESTLSAVTREYTAPELLVSSVLRDPKATATKLSDIFSLAVTLLVAATGEIMVYPGSVFQRQAMATQGWQVLSLVRSGEGGARVPRQGIVERGLEKSVLKANMGRIAAGPWLDIIENMMKGEPRKKL